MDGFSWDRRIARAGELSKTHAAASGLLSFYQGLAGFQKEVFEKLASADDHSISSLLPYFPRLLSLVRKTGSPALVQAADRLASGSREDWHDLLDGVWQHDEACANLPAETLFFASALLQPYAEFLAKPEFLAKQSTTSPVDTSQQRCPFCGSKPQVAVLRPEGDGAKRSLLCSMCSTEWTFRRLVCPNCGEEQKDRLPIFIATEFDYVRVDACDTCHTYIKAIDLTKNGNAVPVVDELASVSLNLWATENNYQKLSPNLFGV
jgi:FdhE protein